MSTPHPIYQRGNSYHVVRRGNNQQTVFFEPTDYIRYLDYLEDALLRYGVFCHAYVLMPNHVHLLLSPSTNEGISRMMELVGNRYVENLDQRRDRSDSLWEDDHCSAAILDDNYLWAVHRYIELNPVRAGMVSYPEGHYWSSYAHNALDVENPVVSPHNLYLDLGGSAAARCHTYRGMFQDRVGLATEFETIRQATISGEPLGKPRLAEVGSYNAGQSPVDSEPARQ
jgi:putative transposase